MHLFILVAGRLGALEVRPRLQLRHFRPHRQRYRPLEHRRCSE